MRKWGELSRLSRFFEPGLDFIRERILLSIALFLFFSWAVLSVVAELFEVGAPGANIRNLWDSLWWGEVTMLTVGYGDRYPVTAGGRLSGSLLMGAGVVAVGMFTAKVSSIFLERALKEARGVVDAHHLKNHFIICGWKRDIHLLLTHILDLHPDVDSGQLVLIAHLQSSDIEGLKAMPRLERLKVLVGDFFSEEVLKRASPQTCRKVLILADQLPTPSGQIPTITESDARTIMTAMTLSNIARGVNIAAEILDAKMDQYLKIAHVNEIIYSREYSRLLLGNASSGTGVMNVIHGLLDPSTSAFLVTQAIDERMFNRTYGELKARYQGQPASHLLLGVMENSGNSHQVKEIALRKAQQTPDVAKLVQNLKSIKEMKFNHPVFNPPEDYVISPGSMAIVLETRVAEGRA